MSAPKKKRSKTVAPIRLDVGAGEYPARDVALREVDPDGWTTVDAYLPADVQADMRHLPYKDGKVDEIWCDHALEHLRAPDAREALVEFLRVLRPGGKATIKVPNLAYAAKYFLTGTDRAWAYKLIFGDQSTPGDDHLTGWETHTLAAELQEVGFHLSSVYVEWNHSQETIVAEVVKPGA